MTSGLLGKFIKMNFESEEWRGEAHADVSFTTWSKSDWVLREATDFQEIPFTTPLQHHPFQVTLTRIINEDWCRLESVTIVNGPLSLTGDCVTVNRSLWSVRGIMAHGGHGAQWSVRDDHNITLLHCYMLHRPKATLLLTLHWVLCLRGMCLRFPSTPGHKKPILSLRRR